MQGEQHRGRDMEIHNAYANRKTGNEDWSQIMEWQAKTLELLLRRVNVQHGPLES